MPLPAGQSKNSGVRASPQVFDEQAITALSLGECLLSFLHFLLYFCLGCRRGSVRPPANCERPLWINLVQRCASWLQSPRFFLFWYVFTHSKVSSTKSLRYLDTDRIIAEKDLGKALLDDYDKRFRPVRNARDSMNVSVRIMLLTLLDVVRIGRDEERRNLGFAS